MRRRGFWDSGQLSAVRRIAISHQQSAVRKIDHKLTVCGTEGNCLNRDLWEWGTGNKLPYYEQEGEVRKPRQRGWGIGV